MNMHTMYVHWNPSHRSTSWKWINYITFTSCVLYQLRYTKSQITAGESFLIQQTIYNKIRIMVWE